VVLNMMWSLIRVVSQEGEEYFEDYSFLFSVL